MVREAIEKAAQELGLEKDQFDVEILESQKKSLFKTGYVKIRVHTVDGAGSSSEAAPAAQSSSRAESKPAVANPLPQDDFEQKLLSFV